MATKNTPKEIGKKIASKGAPKLPPKTLEKTSHAPLDTNKTKVPLRESGTTLPPLVKGK